MTGIDDICGHPDPAWRERADTLVMCDLTNFDLPGRWEQLWAKRVGEHEFVLCCIPFFAYGVALGDKFTASPSRRFEWVLDTVRERAENVVIRVLLHENAEEWIIRERQDELISDLEEHQIKFEVLKLGYVAISCERDSRNLAEVQSMMHAFATLEWGGYELASG